MDNAVTAFLRTPFGFLLALLILVPCFCVVWFLADVCVDLIKDWYWAWTFKREVRRQTAKHEALARQAQVVRSLAEWRR